MITYKNGKKTDVSEYGADGSIRNKVIYNYDGNNLSDETVYNSDGALVGKLIYKYEGGKLAREYEYFADGSLDTEKQYTYTSSGKKDSIVTIKADGEIAKKEVFR